MAAAIMPSTCSRHGPQLSDCARFPRANRAQNIPPSKREDDHRIVSRDDIQVVLHGYPVWASMRHQERFSKIE